MWLACGSRGVWFSCGQFLIAGCRSTTKTQLHEDTASNSVQCDGTNQFGRRILMCATFPVARVTDHRLGVERLPRRRFADSGMSYLLSVLGMQIDYNVAGRRGDVRHTVRSSSLSLVIPVAGYPCRWLSLGRGAGQAGRAATSASTRWMTARRKATSAWSDGRW